MGRHQIAIGAEKIILTADEAVLVQLARMLIPLDILFALEGLFFFNQFRFLKSNEQAVK